MAGSIAAVRVIRDPLGLSCDAVTALVCIEHGLGGRELEVGSQLNGRRGAPVRIRCELAAG